MKDKQLMISVNMTEEWRRAIEWNVNDGQPLTDDEIGEHLCREILKDRDELIEGRHGYREHRRRVGRPLASRRMAALQVAQKKAGHLN